jgi:flagellar protein FliO/FliZ
MQLAIFGSNLDAFVQLITLVIIFAFVLALTYYATRWVGNFQKQKMQGSNIQVLETMRISNSKYIQIIKAGKKCFVIAVCKDTVTYLCEVNEDELIYQENSSQIKSESFKAILDKFKKDKPED